MKISCFKTLLLSIFVILIFTVPSVAFAQTEAMPENKHYEGVIEEVLESTKNENGGFYQKLKIKIINENIKGEQFIIESGLGDAPVTQEYKEGDNVVLAGYLGNDGQAFFFIDDYVRRGPLIYLFLIFIAMAVFVGGKRGFTSFLGMIITFLMIFWLVLPKISAGSNPIFIVFIFSLFSIPITFYLSHGVSKKTHIAIAGTFISLFVTVALTVLFVNATKLTGFTSDEASFLQVLKGQEFSMRGILLAGILIGMLGVLDDITVSQSAVVFQLKQANKDLNFIDLYKRSMDVGRDHIASMINTLILVYTGASLPLLLLFTDSSHTFNQVVNYEIVASEIVRTMLGSIGLILAVPVTTFIAASLADADKGGGKK